MSLFRDEAPILSPSAAVEDFNNHIQYKLHKRETTTIAGLSATSASQTAFVVGANDKLILDAVEASFGTASTSGTLQVEYAPSGTAQGSGTNQLTGTISLAGTANTPVAGTIINKPNSAAPGDRFNIILAGTLTSLANAAVTLYFRRA